MNKLSILALSILALSILLTACAEAPPSCTETFFYNDIPGCAEKLAKWKAANPEAAVKFDEDQAKKSAEMMDKVLNKILK